MGSGRRRNRKSQAANALAGRLRSMPMTVHSQSWRFARQFAACSSPGIGALGRGWVLRMIGGLGCCALSLLAQTTDSQTAGESNKSWTVTSDLKGNNVNPTRVIESHSQNGNRTLDTKSVLREVDGHFEPYQDIENETLQLDATTIRTTTRSYSRDFDGRKELLQVTEEEKRTLPGGDSNVVRITSNADLNGRLQPVQ